MYDAILLGGISHNRYGRTIGPYRLRTACENAGYTLKVLDYAWGLNHEKMLKLLEKLVTPRTKILGISAAWFEWDVNVNQWISAAFFDEFRRLYPHVKVVVGGSSYRQNALLIRYTDWLITGFADIALPKLLDHLTTGSPIMYWIEKKVKVIKADVHYVVKEMDQLETVMTAEDGLLEHEPFPIEVSRGCIFKCTFCSHPFLGKKDFNYIRSPESIARELRRNYDLFGTHRYVISDDTFNDSIEKLDIFERALSIAAIPNFEFLAYIKPELLVIKPEMVEKLLSMGLKGAHMGIESMKATTRKSIGKGMPIEKILVAAESLRSRGVRLQGSFIVGLPDESPEEIRNTVNFLIENRHRYFNSYSFNVLGITMGIDGEGYSDIEKNPAKYDLEVFKVKGMTRLGWKYTSSGFDHVSATALADESAAKVAPYITYGGWALAQAWQNKTPENELDKSWFSNAALSTVMKNGADWAHARYVKDIGS